MSAKKKFYIGSISHRSGEYYIDSAFKFTTTGNPYKYSDRIAKTFYGNRDKDLNSDSNGYYFNGGEVCVTAGNPYEISETIYLGLANCTSIPYLN